MNLYLLWVDENGYDEYDSVIIASESEESALKFYPTIKYITVKGSWSPEKVHIRKIGEAVDGTEEGMILGSFNAG